MSLPQFLAWEERQELRHEFDGFQPVAMTGGTAAHDAIQMNLHAALVSRLRGRPCRPHGSDLKVEVVGRVRYPDAFVVCTPVAPRQTVVTDPAVVFEVQDLDHRRWRRRHRAVERGGHQPAAETETPRQFDVAA